MVLFQKKVKTLNKNGTITGRKGSKFLNEMVTFQKKGQKWYHFKKGSKILRKNGTLSEKSRKSSTKRLYFRKGSKFHNQKWYHFRRGSKILNKNVAILVRKGSKFLNKNGTISEKGQKSSTKMVPFQKRVKSPQQKWYYFRKGSKILNKNGTISENGKNSSTKWYHFRQ